MGVYILIAMGGAAGAVARYMAYLVTPFLFGIAQPWATLSVNVIGSFALGLIAPLFLGQQIAIGEDPGNGQWLRYLLILGFLGGFTTFSTFSLDALQFLMRGEYPSLFYYVAGSILLSFVAIAGGFYLTLAAMSA